MACFPYLLSASCSPQQVSQENLFLPSNISLAENCLRQELTDEFCSISSDKSRNASSREVTCQRRAGSARCVLCPSKRLAVSQVKHLISFVIVPSNNDCTNVLPLALFFCTPPLSANLPAGKRQLSLRAARNLRSARLTEIGILGHSRLELFDVT